MIHAVILLGRLCCLGLGVSCGVSPLLGSHILGIDTCHALVYIPFVFAIPLTCRMNVRTAWPLYVINREQPIGFIFKHLEPFVRPYKLIIPVPLVCLIGCA